MNLFSKAVAPVLCITALLPGESSGTSYIEPEGFGCQVVNVGGMKMLQVTTTLPTLGSAVRGAMSCLTRPVDVTMPGNKSARVPFWQAFGVPYVPPGYEVSAKVTFGPLTCVKIDTLGLPQVILFTGVSPANFTEENIAGCVAEMTRRTTTGPDKDV